MRCFEHLFLFLNLLKLYFSVVPIWKFENSAIDLLSSSPTLTHTYTTNGFNCQIEKTITKNTDNSISYKKYLKYNGYKNPREIPFEDATYFASNFFSYNNIFCPRGKFHPYKIDYNQNITNSNFEEKGDWDLKCFNHNTGFFIVFYLNNKKKSFYHSKNQGYLDDPKNEDFYSNEIYDFLLKDGYHSAHEANTNVNDNFKLTYIFSDNNHLILSGGVFTINSGETKINKQDYNKKNLIEVKAYSRAYYTEDCNFHYFTYNDVSDFLGGYSTSGVNCDDYSDISSVNIFNHSISPIEFLNEVEIKYINFISGTKYAYYEIYDKNTEKTYHGFMDIKQNKVLFNTDKEITTFVPYSNSEMLAITSDSAYKICIYKNNDECSETCDTNLILDVDGNKCQADTKCGVGKIKLMPNDICVDESFCDLKIFLKNDTHCGLCKEFYPDSTPYKLFNTSGCASNIPSNSISYNENTHLKIYKCKELFHPYGNDKCVPDYCFQNCLECYEASDDENDQKCLTCKEGYYLNQNNNNCLKCTNEKCSSCSYESNLDKLCTNCIEGYEKVKYPSNSYYHCLKKEEISEKFYLEEDTQIYKPCHRKCKKCDKEGNEQNNNCLECNYGYMFRPGNNPGNNCVAENDYVYLDAYGNVKNLPNSNCREEAPYKIRDENTNKIMCVNNCKDSIKYLYLFNGNCLESCPNKTVNNSFVCEVNKDECSLGGNKIYLEGQDDMKVVETLAKTYMREFKYTSNHIARYYNKNFSIILYKNSSCIKKQKLSSPTIDFKNCSEVVKNYYNVTELVAAVADKKTNSNPTSFYGFYHPISGIKLDSDKLCNDSSVQITENLMAILDEEDEDYSLQVYLINQGINIFDENSDFYADICFDFDNPLSRDIPLKDRQRSAFPDAKLCDEGCVFEGMNFDEMTASCSCKYRDISQSNIEPIIEDMFGDVFELIEASNLEVLKCYNNFFKNFGKSIGGIISIILIVADIIFSVLFFVIELVKLKRYIFNLTDKYLSYLKQSIQTKVKIKNPPKKSSDDTTNSNIKIINNRQSRKNDILSEHGKKSNSFAMSKDKIIVFNNKEPKNDLIRRNRLITEKKKKTDLKKTSPILNELKKNKKFFEEYLSTSFDDMAFDDAIVKDDRNFREILCEILKEKQIIMNTFVAHDPIKTRFIKYIFFILDICLYLVVNGLFFGEEYLSLLYNLDEEDNFFSFFPRTIDKLIYATFVSMVIAYITDFFFVEEKKIIGIFRREKDNRHVLKELIVKFIKDLQNRYTSFIIMVFVILILSFYYLVCFNRVYPKTQMEWIKSSIVIMIFINIISVLKCLYEAGLRVLSFRFKSERLYKLSQIFD